MKQDFLVIRRFFSFLQIMVVLVLALGVPAVLMAASPPERVKAPVEKVKAATQEETTVVCQPGPLDQKNKPFIQSLEPYKPIYVVSTWFMDGEGSDQGYQDQELLISLSFKRGIFWNVYFGYSHKAFWQIYDHANSRPFREHNYNPELFLEWDDILNLDHVRFGLIEHESNGEQLRYDKNGNPVNHSRTWNRTYLYADKSVHPVLNLGLKLWVVTDSDDPDDGSFIVDNSDIEQYMGSSEFYVELGRFPSQLSVMLRQGWKEGTETIRVDGRLPLHLLTGSLDESIDIFVQFFSGYGDSLIDYNRKITRVSVGVAFR